MCASGVGPNKDYREIAIWLNQSVHKTLWRRDADQRAVTCGPVTR